MYYCIRVCILCILMYLIEPGNETVAVISCVWHHLSSVFVLSVEFCFASHAAPVVFVNFRHTTRIKTSQFSSLSPPSSRARVLHTSAEQHVKWRELPEVWVESHFRDSFYNPPTTKTVFVQRSSLRSRFFRWFSDVFTGWQFAHTSF